MKSSNHLNTDPRRPVSFGLFQKLKFGTQIDLCYFLEKLHKERFERESTIKSPKYRIC